MERLQIFVSNAILLHILLRVFTSFKSFQVESLGFLIYHLQRRRLASFFPISLPLIFFFHFIALEYLIKLCMLNG